MFDTRYLCTGDQFLVVGNASSQFFRTRLLDHFRGVYFQIGLICHYQRSALLAFTDQAADAIKLLSGPEPEQSLADAEFRARVTALQTRFLKFRTRAWFAEVSNQLQGRELHRLWREQLGLDRLFDHVEKTTQPLYSALAEYETRTLSRIAFRGLAITIGVAAVPISLASFAGMEYTAVGIALGVFLTLAALAAVLIFLESQGDPLFRRDDA